MVNKIGIVIFIGTLVASVAFSSSANIFVDLQALLFVIFISLSLSFMELKDIGSKKILDAFKKYLIPAGYIGALIGLIQTFNAAKSIEQIFPSIAISLVTIFYAYTLFYIINSISISNKKNI